MNTHSYWFKIISIKAFPSWVLYGVPIQPLYAFSFSSFKPEIPWISTSQFRSQPFLYGFRHTIHGLSRLIDSCFSQCCWPSLFNIQWWRFKSHFLVRSIIFSLQSFTRTNHRSFISIPKFDLPSSESLKFLTKAFALPSQAFWSCFRVALYRFP